MMRGLWKGALSFGLVNIPITLIGAEKTHEIRFKLLDKQDHQPIGYRYFNKVTGKDVSRNAMTKAFEYEKDKYVILSEEDFKAANVKASQTLEIESFIDLEQVSPIFFEKPYYLLPLKGGEKGYHLLREVLAKKKKAAVGKIVLHTKQHLAAIIACENYLLLEILRFAHEIKQLDRAEVPQSNLKPNHREFHLAEELVDGMTEKWNPEKYKDTYYDDVMKRIHYKVEHGGATEIKEADLREFKPTAPIVDLMPLLKKSLEAKAKRSEKHHKTRRAS